MRRGLLAWAAKCCARYFDMSRLANIPIPVPDGVEVTLAASRVTVKGPKGSLEMPLHARVAVRQEENGLRVSAGSRDHEMRAMLGTTWALLNNMMVGVSAGFEKRLLLNGVGYRTALSGTALTLTLGYSHPVKYQLPEGVSAVLPSPTEIILSSNDKQSLGQVAAEVRALRPPEPYKGKGIFYADETVRRKEAKKK